jgi:hypothetical protein
MKFGITKRPAQVGPSINTRTEKHGEENVPGVDIPLSAIFLEKDEVNNLLQDPDAYDALYTEDRSKQLEPRFLTIEPIRLSDKFTGARVTISVNGAGEGTDLVLKPAKISKIALSPQVGGLTLMSCTVQGNPSDHTDVLALLNLKCRVQILGANLEETAAEPELPLDHKDQAAEPAADTSPYSGMGRKIAATSKKKARRTRADIDG